MKGIQISNITQQLFSVEKEFVKDPFSSLPNLKKRMNTNIKKSFGDSFERIEDVYDKIPLRSYKRFSFDELCKFYYSTNVYSLHKELQNHFESDLDCDLVRKISSSMWRWGMGEGDWNQVVNFYESIKNFEFVKDPNFEIRLDHTKYYNERGYSKYSDTYLDGVFGILIYYKSKHVMTIGFSLMSEGKILIQQIQLKNKKGNRFLYKLPCNRVEFVLDLFTRNFPNFQIYLVSGDSAIDKILGQYQSQLDRLMKFVDNPNSLDEYKREKYDYLNEQIIFLKTDKNRLVSFYKNTGKFDIDNIAIKLHSLTHYKVVA